MIASESREANDASAAEGSFDFWNIKTIIWRRKQMAHWLLNLWHTTFSRDKATVRVTLTVCLSVWRSVVGFFGPFFRKWLATTRRYFELESILDELENFWVELENFWVELENFWDELENIWNELELFNLS